MKESAYMDVCVVIHFICVHGRAYVCMFACVCMYARVYVNVRAHMCKCVIVCTWMCKCMYLYMCTRVLTVHGSKSN